MLAAFACMAMLSACNADENEAKTAQPAATAVAASPLMEASAEFASGNYGRAASLAAEHFAKNPLDAQAHLLQARAEARLGNAGNATRALERALQAGIPNFASALRSPDFDFIRDDVAFRRLMQRASVDLDPTSAPGRREPEDTLRAGDVSISETATSETIRAGDVVLDVSK